MSLKRPVATRVPSPANAFSPASASPECIRLRGVRQNNLKGFDLDLPLGKYVVVTGLSGAGKSSLVFDTLHAEGQRRYVETFSAYTRQFLDLLDKPKVDSIENIRPSIAIEQSNTVKTSRSTVGTMTELTDFFKVWFSHVAACYDPATGELVEDDTPASIWEKSLAAHAGRAVVIAFKVTKPANLSWAEILTNLKGQSYVRVLLPAHERPTPNAQRPTPNNSASDDAASNDTTSNDAAANTTDATRSRERQRVDSAPVDAARIDDLLSAPADSELGRWMLDVERSTFLFVAQDRITLEPSQRTRFLEAAETALHFGQGQLHLFAPPEASPKPGEGGSASQLSTLSSQPSALLPAGHYSRGLHSPKTGRTFRAASPALFSFNSPLGACPKCRGFGRVIEIDTRLAVPDQSLSIDDGALKCWEGEVYRASLDDLRPFAKKKKIPFNVPFASLTEEQKRFIIDGEPGYGGENGKTFPQFWYGVKGFFAWLEKNTYKTHVRVFLSRYRAYNPCPTCAGTRLQTEALCWKWSGYTLPELYQLPVDELLALVRKSEIRNPKSQIADSARSSEIALDSIRTRLRYLQQVGLGYLTLDRTSKTLSGGEVQRVNLTSCLGTSLVDTLFVLDEPSVGLHPRDIDRLIAIIRTLTDAGNTVVVVEHDEAMIRAADHVIEIGPEPGARGGHVVFQGTIDGLQFSPASITGAYLSGRQRIETPGTRRVIAPPRSGERQKADAPWLTFRNATKHNLRDLTVALPLQRLVALSGVSGSGKSTLLDNVIHQGLLAKRLQLTEDPASIQSITGDDLFGEIVLVDQSPLSRTPRSNAALYTEAWELIRELYADTPAARAAGFNASSFSFNSGDGRCDHCQGLGYERVEMQFLSDVFVPCPICEARRFKPEVLAIAWRDRSVADLLNTSVDDALALFADHPTIRDRLAILADVGLGYLTLGQPLNTLSGGESQRLKLVRYLSGYAGEIPSVGSASKILDPKSKILTKSASPAVADASAQSKIENPKSRIPAGALLLLDEPTTGLHRHDVKRLIGVLQALVDRGHSVVVIEHNLDVLKSADWIVEIGPDAGAAGGRIVAEGPPEVVARANTATSPYLRAALAEESRAESPVLRAAEDPGSYKASASGSSLSALSSQLVLTGARENNLKNISLSIAHRELTVVTGVSGSGKSTLAFDIIFAEGQRRFMESMSPYARQFVEQLPRPSIDRLTGIPPTVAIEQRITRGSRKSTVATITEVAQYLRLLYARLGVQHHPDTDKPVQPLTAGHLKKLLATVLASPKAAKAKHLYLCAPLVRGRKGHHQPIATWIEDHGYELMRVDGRLQRVDTFQKLDRYSEHDIEVVVADLKAPPASAKIQSPESRAKSKTKNAKPTASASASASVSGSQLSALDSQLSEALRLGHGSCFLALPSGDVLSWFSTTRTDIETGESFPELDPKQFSHNSPRGWCPTCRGHGRVFPWMLVPDEENDDDPAARLRAFGIESESDLADTGTPCPECHGDRLARIPRAVKLHFASRLEPLSLPALLRSTPSQLLLRLRLLDLDERGKLITQDIVPQIEERLKFLDHVGLGYLSLDRPTDTLSGGEAQRIRLAAQLGTNLAGVLYVLDEPSIGLHARDNDQLIATLLSLRDKGNTLLVVEHDDELMERADQIIDLGPAAGIHGGELLAHGTPAEIKASDRSLTGLFLARGITHPLRGAYREISPEGARLVRARAASPAQARRGQATPLQESAGASAPAAGLRPLSSDWLTLTGARLRNLKDFTLRLPLGRLIMAAGPSGAGKSTLFRDLLHPAVAHAIKAKKARLTGKEFVKATGFASDTGPGSQPIASPKRSTGGSALNSQPAVAPFDSLDGAHAFKSVIEVDQSPIGKTPRSTPATYLGIFDLIRAFFATIPEAKIRGYSAGRFSFNTAGGRCETCSGGGRIKLEMAFMPDTYLPCDDCRGTRYAPELADITWKGKNIAQVLALTFEEAAAFFDFHSQLSQVCQLMVDCGLGYLTLGQSSPTLSGGEAQRLKLVTELANGLATYTERSRGIAVRNLYLLEEPTIGLHLSDCEKLIKVLHSLVDQGHTVVVIEHHLDLLAEADYILELGPVGGPDGGQLLYQGPLAGLLKTKGSPTAPYLAKKLSTKPT